MARKKHVFTQNQLQQFRASAGMGKKLQPIPGGACNDRVDDDEERVGVGGKLQVGNTARKPGAQCLIYVLFYFQSRGFSPYCARCLRDIRVRC